MQSKLVILDIIETIGYTDYFTNCNKQSKRDQKSHTDTQSLGFIEHLVYVYLLN